MCTLPTDFTGAPASGIYSTVTGGNGGVHAHAGRRLRRYQPMLDHQELVWIRDGKRRFLRVAYGEGWLENTQSWGVGIPTPIHGPNADNATGVIIESGNGAAHQNRELFLRRGFDIVHDWQEAVAGPWNAARVPCARPMNTVAFPADALDCPAAVQSSFNRNYELVYRSDRGKIAPHLLRPGLEDVVRHVRRRAINPRVRRLRPATPQGIPGSPGQPRCPG